MAKVSITCSSSGVRVGEAWQVYCDVPGCTQRIVLLTEQDAAALAVAFDIDEREAAVTIAIGRGWKPGTHVGEPNHWRCPKHHEVP
jgi:hypothetical protein